MGMRENKSVPIGHSMLLIFTCCLASSVMAGEYSIGERPVIETHLDQSELENHVAIPGERRRRGMLQKLLNHGEKLFEARFNILDGERKKKENTNKERRG